MTGAASSRWGLDSAAEAGTPGASCAKPRGWWHKAEWEAPAHFILLDAVGQGHCYQKVNGAKPKFREVKPLSTASQQEVGIRGSWLNTLLAAALWVEENLGTVWVGLWAPY